MPSPKRGPLPSPGALRAALQAETADETNAEQLKPYTVIKIDETIRGVRYQGDFGYSVPKIADLIQIGRIKSAYLPDGAKADTAAAQIVEAMCYLEVTLDAKRPAWWTPMEFHSTDLLMIVYAKAVAYANTFLGRGKERGSAGSADVEQDDGGDAAADDGDVEQDLQAPEQRSKTVIAHSS